MRNRMTSSPAVASNPAVPVCDLHISVQLHLLEGNSETLSEIIRRVRSGLFQLLSPVYLRPDRKLELLLQGRRLEATVVYCKKESAGTYDIGIRLTRDAHIRNEDRNPIDLLTTLKSSGSPTPIPVRVVDLSPSGLGLELNKPIPVGATVSVDLKYGIAIGDIRHSAQKAAFHRAGVCIQEFTRQNGAKGLVLTNLSCDSRNLAALAGFVRFIEASQSRYEAMLFSL